MLFNSIEFLIFAAVFFAAYVSLRGDRRLLLLVSASYFFYGWWDWRFTSLLALSTCVDYWVGLRMAAAEGQAAKRLRLLQLSLLSNLGILGVFKYFDFFSSSTSALLAGLGLETTPFLLDVVVPVGISFYTFQTLSYTIDLYRGHIATPERRFLNFAVYVAMFPQLVAGPIVRASKLLPQIRAPEMPGWDGVLRALELILWGFFLKLCLADTAGLVVDPRFASPDSHGALSHVVGVLAFSMQIYGDFAGYSLIAIGLGRLLGYDFGINFNKPYFAQSFSEFWERWHISLSQWIRDYLYISLGGNRGSRLATFRNLVVTMFLAGLWHGAGWTYVIWGLLHGAYLVAQRLLEPYLRRFATGLRCPSWLQAALAVAVVFFFTNVAWVFFRAPTIESASGILGIIASGEGWRILPGQQQINIIETMMFTMVVLLVDYLSGVSGLREKYLNSTALRMSGALLLVWIILLSGKFNGTSFIYFQF